MRISSVSLKNFRNYKEENIHLSPGINVIFGDNAQGKTNFLEGIHLFSSGKSHRGVGDKELILRGSNFSELTLSFSSERREMESNLRLFTDKRREMKINGVKVNKKKEWLGHFSSVLFYPEELNLVKEGPEERRRFLDQAIGMLRPSYDHYLGLYQNILRQKSRLLRKIEENPSYRKTLPVWNESLIELGSRIIFYRQSFIDRLSPMADAVQQEITGGKEILSFTYESPFSGLSSIDAIKEKFREKQENMFETEIAAAKALIGPHRDDIAFTLSGEAAKTFASQGQQRTIVLSLKLAQTELIFEETGEYPVLLLDDILSELDSNRRNYLTEKIKGKQVIITCTDREFIPDSEGVSYFKSEEGALLPCI